MTGTWRTRLQRLWWVIPTLAVAFPLLRLWPLDGQFGTDWYNHRWLAAWSGEYLRQHGSVPVVINTTKWAGMPYPVFYGTLFYPALSLLTTYFAAGFVLRLAVVIATWLQYRLVVAALVALDVPPWIARGIACLSIWTIYPLTNLYHRAAIPEYVAVALLTSMVAGFFLLLNARDAATRLRLGLGLGLLFAVAAGSHPTTALYSLPILALLLVAAYFEKRRDRAFWWGLAKALAIPIALVAAVLGPWIFALAKYQPDLRIMRDDRVRYYGGIDDWPSRFFPIPHDSRTAGVPLAHVSVPYLDTQLNLAMLVLLIGWLAILLRKHRVAGMAGLRAISLAFGAFAIFLVMSLYPVVWDILPASARMLQIAYRAVSYQNIALLLAVFMLASAMRRHRVLAQLPSMRGVLVGCMLLSGLGVAIKWIHATRTMEIHGSTSPWTTRAERHDTEALPVEFYGYFAYATPAQFTPLSAEGITLPNHATIPIGSGDAFGIPQPLNLNISHATWVSTNVQAFPWNHLAIDGVPVPEDELRVDDIRLAVHVPAGRHAIELSTEADSTWSALRTASFVILVLWFAGFCVLTIRARPTRPLRA